MDNRPKPRLVYGELGQLYALHGGSPVVSSLSSTMLSHWQLDSSYRSVAAGYDYGCGLRLDSRSSQSMQPATWSKRTTPRAIF